MGSSRVIDAIDRVGSHWGFTDAVVLGVCLAVVGAAALLNPSPDVVSFFGIDVPVMCSFRQLTGMNCPGCGLTRSFSFMAHGRVLDAFQVNWFGPAAFGFVAAQIPWRTIRLVRRHRARGAAAP